jgi:hypothetical protein
MSVDLLHVTPRWSFLNRNPTTAKVSLLVLRDVNFYKYYLRVILILLIVTVQAGSQTSDRAFESKLSKIIFYYYLAYKKKLSVIYIRLPS